MKEKCYICEKGEIENKKVDVKAYGIIIGKFEAELCGKCGELSLASMSQIR